MLYHPLVLAIGTMDILALFLLARTALTAVRTKAGWTPGSSAREQIRLETAYETGAIATRAVFAIVAGSTVVLLIAITNVFPQMVPGAMCGTGVIQAMEGHGPRMFTFRISGLVLLYFWVALERLNRARPDFPLTRQNAGIFLLACPFLFLGIVDTFDAFRSVDVQKPVDCCSAVYRLSMSRGEVRSVGGTSDAFLVPAFVVLTLVMVISGLGGLVRRSPGIFSVSAAIVSLAWAPVSGITLVRVFAAYHYEVLEHHCPWCLFLPEHCFVGFPLFFSLGIAFVEAPLSYLLVKTSRRCPALANQAMRRARVALAVMLLFAMLFMAMTLVPALLWRLRFGVWIGSGH
jgi:hypothetical protein